LRNLAHRHEAFIPSEGADGDWEETVATAAKRIEWETPLPPGRGRGLALGLKSGPTTGLSYSMVRLLADGSALVYAGTSDMGQGARTVFAQITSEELGVPLDRISVVMGDTAVVPYDQQTSASRSTVLMGTAVLRACRDIQGQVRAMASGLYQVDESDIAVADGVVRLPDRELTVVEVAQDGLGRLGGELLGRGEMRKDADPDHPLGGTAAFFEFNCTAVEVDVDQETGEIVLVRYVTVSDVGRALNPLQVAGQDEGAAVMGIGHTIMEHIILDELGRIRNLGALDYRIPTSLDLPREMHSESVENADGPGPYGVKGVSEASVLAAAPAIAAAVRQAAGVVINDLPLTPQRVWEALMGKKRP
jgi:CO/xanthine dehydrogenase Mo-binding subunit